VNELQAIVDAYADARARGERAALATIVSVEGSAYRRPGARMLITASGRTTGTISGGCLERDVAEHAARVMEPRVARVIKYDTRGDEDIVWGSGLGCNGVVRVLLESLHEGSAGAGALQFIAERLQARKGGVIATVIAGKTNAENGEARAATVGARLLLDDEVNIHGQCLMGRGLATRVRADALEILAGKRAVLRAYEIGDRRAEIFYDVITPSRALVVFGAEQDALPLVRQARAVGWHVTIVDTRARPATGERFAEADEIMLCRAADVTAHVSLTENTAAVVMTHNYLDDVELLRALLPSPVCYLGLLGPRQRAEKLLEELGAGSRGLMAAQLARLHSPIGMDIGAETPEEIALSIIAEIKAVSAARRGGFLRDRAAPIHYECGPELVGLDAGIETYAPTPENASLITCHTS
jgi:xanthine/CO dehydrogenase XdhC/CoxF family maturation factor